MTTTIIEWDITVAGVAADAEFVVLSDPTGSYGVMRKDNSAVVVAAGVSMTNPTTGHYSYEFTDPAPGLEYRYYIKATIDGDVYYYERDYSTNAVVADAEGRYTDASGLYGKFGQDNILTWATFSDSESETTITARIQAALDLADDYVDDRLRGGPNIVPFTAGSIPETIKEITTILAGVLLYNARGTGDFEEEGITRLSSLKTLAEAQLGMIRSGRMKLSTFVGQKVPDTYVEEMSTYKVVDGIVTDGDNDRIANEAWYIG